MTTSPIIRPVTGKLLVGGDFYLHTGYGISKSWLAEEDPSKYIFTPKDFDSNDEDSFGYRFAIPAMDTLFPSVLLDIPMARDNGALKQSQGISVLYLPEGEPWLNAKFVCTMNWNEDLITRDTEGKVWQKWDSDWFRERVHKYLQEAQSRASNDLSKAQEVLASLEMVSTALS